MTVRQRAKRRPVIIWASQFSASTGLFYHLRARKLGDNPAWFRSWDFYPQYAAWSSPK